MNRWLYRYVDEDGVVHVEETRGKFDVSGLRAACGLPVAFGEEWTDDHRMIVTCVRCLGQKH